MSIIDIVEKYNNYNSKYYEHITDFKSISFCLVSDTLKEENWSSQYLIQPNTNVNVCVDIFMVKF